MISKEKGKEKEVMRTKSKGKRKSPPVEKLSFANSYLIQWVFQSVGFK